MSVSPGRRSIELGQSPDPDRFAGYNKLNFQLRTMRTRRIRNSDANDRRGQLTVREVNEAMQTMVDEMRKHGKEFEEKTKVSCVDTIKLRNSKVIQEPPKPKQNRNRRSIDSFAGELRDTSERKVLHKSPSNM